MTIPYCIQIGDTVNDEAQVESLILSVFSEINQKYNNWNPDSEVSQLNSLAAYKTFLISPELATFLHYVDEIVLLTEGRFDPTVGSLQKMWKAYLTEGNLPPQNRVEEIKADIGWGTLHCEDRCFWKEKSSTAIDLCGIAKGYAVDLLVEKLQASGYHNVYVEWGGEIRALGHHPSDRPWKIGIQGLSSIDLTDTAIATSGSYIQNWSIDGVHYTHIIDPITREPLHNSTITSVSVIAKSCREADAIATALMLFPTKEAAQQWAQSKNYRVYIW